MDKFTKFTSRAVSLPLNDVDTDMILPAEYLKNVSRTGFGENLFQALRTDDPDFPLNLEKYKGAEVLVAGNNFGCGSSREHAVWAVVQAGFRVIIAKSFADIFYNNGAKNGLMLVTLSAPIVDKMLLDAESGDYEVSVDLESQTVTLPSGEKESFDFDPFRRHCMLGGLDDIDYINSHKAEIDAFRQTTNPTRFSSTEGL